MLGIQIPRPRTWKSQMRINNLYPGPSHADLCPGIQEEAPPANEAPAVAPVVPWLHSCDLR